jgi:hypothetical protein
MPRTFTEHETLYLNKLIERNQDGVSFEPLETPTSASEMRMRARLRGKAFRMLIDLIKVDAAGIINYSDLDDSHVENILLLLNERGLTKEHGKMRRKLLLT